MNNFKDNTLIQTINKDMMTDLLTAIITDDLAQFHSIVNLYPSTDVLMAYRIDNSHQFYLEACLHGRLEMVKMFIENKTYFDLNKIEKSPCQSYYINALMFSIQSGNEQLIDYLLEYYDLHESHQYNNLFYFAIKSGKVSVLEKLHLLGITFAPINNNPHFILPIDFSSKNALGIVKYLHSVGLDINLFDGGLKTTPTLLFKAVHDNNTDIVDYLLKNNAYLHILNCHNHNILSFSIRRASIKNDAQSYIILNMLLQTEEFKNIKIIDNTYYFYKFSLSLDLLFNDNYKNVKTCINHHILNQNILSKSDEKISKIKI